MAVAPRRLCKISSSIHYEWPPTRARSGAGSRTLRPTAAENCPCDSRVLSSPSWGGWTISHSLLCARRRIPTNNHPPADRLRLAALGREAGATALWATSSRDYKARFTASELRNTAAISGSSTTTFELAFKRLSYLPRSREACRRCRQDVFSPGSSEFRVKFRLNEWTGGQTRCEK
jgi:hypothetical protein